MKKTGLALVLVIALTVLLAGCGGSESNKAGLLEGKSKVSSSFLGKYQNIEEKEIFLQFNKDGTFEVIGFGKVFEKGTYVVKGDKVEVKNETAESPLEMSINGDKVEDPNGAVWKKTVE